MVLDLLSFFVGFILLLLLFIVVINHKKDKKLNIFFLVVLGAVGSQRFLHGLDTFNLVDSYWNPFQGNLIFPFFKIMGYYLFFENQLLKSTPYKKIALHLFAPAVIALIISVLHPSLILVQVTFLLFSSVYIGLAFFLLWKHVYNKKNYKELIHFQSIKVWVTILFGFYVLMFLLSNYIFLSQAPETFTRMYTQFYNSSALFWFFIILFILKNPVILYGEQVLLEKINNTTKEEVIVWRSKKQEPTEKEDLEVEKKVGDKVAEIIFALKKWETEVLEDFLELPNLKEVAFQLEYPQSHLKYVFTYYSYCTFSEYQTILKIKYALKLIKLGYLDTRTVDSLATRCHFKTRSTFYKNFKKQIGYTPTEYQAALTTLSK
jgi:AraC-like DNA-binding protein